VCCIKQLSSSPLRRVFAMAILRVNMDVFVEWQETLVELGIMLRAVRGSAAASPPSYVSARRDRFRCAEPGHWESGLDTIAPI